MDRRDPSEYPSPRVAIPKRARLLEDFYGANSSTIPAAAGILVYSQAWQFTGAHPAYSVAANTNGIINVAGDTTNAPSFILVLQPNSISQPFVASKKPIVQLGFAQLGNQAATRRIGLGTTALVADPTNGIFIRFTNAGNMLLVCRAAGVETTLDTGVAAADGVFHNIAIAITTTKVDVYVDEVYKGSITTNIPSANMSLTGGVSNNTASNGLSVDFVDVEQDR